MEKLSEDSHLQDTEREKHLNKPTLLMSSSLISSLCILEEIQWHFKKFVEKGIKR